MKKYLISLLMIFVFPLMVNAETAIVKTEEEFLDNLPFTTNKITDVVLGADIIVTDTVAFYLTKSSSLDLNGHTLTFNSNRDFFVHSNCTNCTMTFKDSSGNNSGKLIMKQNQIVISPATGNCLTTNTIIDGGTYEQIASNTEFGTFKLVHQCSSDANKQNLTIKNGVFNTNNIFFGEKKSVIKIESLTQNISRNTADFRIGFFNNGLDASKISDVISSSSEVLYDGVVENDWTQSLNTRLGNNTIVVRRKEMNLSVDNLDFGLEEEGYLSIVPKNIIITNTGVNIAKIKLITISNDEDFELKITKYNDIAVNGKDNNSYTLKPVDGLKKGTYETDIIVTDINGKTYSAKATFEVKEKEITTLPEDDVDDNNQNNNDNNGGNENINNNNKEENSSNNQMNNNINNNQDNDKVNSEKDQDIKDESSLNSKNEPSNIITENPKTFDNIFSNIFLLLSSLIILFGYYKVIKNCK